MKEMACIQKRNSDFYDGGKPTILKKQVDPANSTAQPTAKEKFVKANVESNESSSNDFYEIDLILFYFLN